MEEVYNMIEREGSANMLSFRVWCYFNSHNWKRKFICKNFHKKHHTLKEWDDGTRKVKLLYCKYCSAYYKSFFGGACLTCKTHLMSAYFIKQCSECRNKGVKLPEFKGAKEKKKAGVIK